MDDFRLMTVEDTAIFVRAIHAKTLKPVSFIKYGLSDRKDLTIFTRFERMNSLNSER